LKFHFYPIRCSISLFYGVLNNIDLEFFALNLHNPFYLHKKSLLFWKAVGTFLYGYSKKAPRPTERSAFALYCSYYNTTISFVNSKRRQIRLKKALYKFNAQNGKCPVCRLFHPVILYLEYYKINIMLK